jgi:hypothetical protein
MTKKSALSRLDGAFSGSMMRFQRFRLVRFAILDPQGQQKPKFKKGKFRRKNQKNASTRRKKSNGNKYEYMFLLR